MSLLDVLNPLKRYQLAAEAVVIAAALAACAYQFHEYSMRQQQIGYSRAQAEFAAAEQVRERAQAQIDAANNQRVQDAQNKANDREQVQRTLNAAVGVSADRLRNAIDQVRGSSNSATVEALRASTAALATVFQDCAGRYRSLATAADGHASDVQTLNDAWPTAPPNPAPEAK
jgi:hypothetical protein